jgi:hypothetical protein
MRAAMLFVVVVGCPSSRVADVAPEASTPVVTAPSASTIATVTREASAAPKFHFVASHGPACTNTLDADPDHPRCFDATTMHLADASASIGACDLDGLPPTLDATVTLHKNGAIASLAFDPAIGEPVRGCVEHAIRAITLDHFANGGDVVVTLRIAR